MTAWVLGGEEPAVLVTQTGDVEAAKAAVLADPVVMQEVAEKWEDLTYDHPKLWLSDSLERAAAWLERAKPVVQHGRFAVNDYCLYEGYKQVWMGFPAEGRDRPHGETAAVMFMPPAWIEEES